MRKLSIAILLVVMTSAAGAAAPEKGLTVKGLRHFSYPTFTRVVFEVEAAAPYVLTKDEGGRRLLFTAYEGPLAVKAKIPSINDGVVKNVEQNEEAGKVFLFINLDTGAGEAKDFVLRNPDRIVLDIARGAAPPLPPAQPGPRSTVIVLDPGHGGRDTGTVTPRGPEKALALELALALRKQIRKKNSEITVLLTREKDQALSLDERAAISNAAGARLFLSLHAGPGNDVKVYLLELDSEPAPGVVAAERRDFLGFEALSEQQEVLWGRQQAAHIRESGSLGRKLMRQFAARDAEPVQAPLALLKPVDAAAVLVEVGAELDRARAVEMIVKGIDQYVRENR